MAYQNFFKNIFKNLRPLPPILIYGMSPTFVNPNPPKNPNDDQKIVFEEPSASNLSYNYMIKQSSINAANSASQALTVTFTAIESTSQEYRELLKRLIALMNEAIMYEVGQSHWDEILEVRCEMQNKQKLLTQYIDYMNYVHKMAEAASEISFLAGMDNLSTTLNQRIDDALFKIQVEKKNNSELEEEYVRVQEETINSYYKNAVVAKEVDNQKIKEIEHFDTA